MTKRFLALFLALILCFALAACSQPDKDPDEIAGADWRTTGIVVANGTITHDGESADVLVTLSEDSAAFYWDTEEQVLFDSVSFPMTIPDARSAFDTISFDDLSADGESDVYLRFSHENGDRTELVWVWDPVERYVFREDLSSFAGSNIADYTGLWEYVGENLWLLIRADTTWDLLDSDGNAVHTGTLWADENGVTLHFDSTGDVLQLDRAKSGDLIDSLNGGTLIPTDEIRSSSPYFEANGLACNALPDAGTYSLEDGVCFYTGLGDGYTTDDCCWEVIINADYTHDGIREIQFDAICYISEDSIPYFGQDYITNTTSELYDYYTGMWLTAATAYDNSERGDNYYLHTVSRNGESFLIEFSYSTQWQYDAGDWGTILTKSYIVYLPEDYDGLVFVAEPQPDNYRDCAKIMQLDSISPEAAILDIDLIDFSNALYFRIGE